MDSNGCIQPEAPNTCIPMSYKPEVIDPDVPTSEECPSNCPTYCPEGQMSCPGEIHSNGCASPDTCVPESYEGNDGHQCPGLCPTYCPWPSVVWPGDISPETGCAMPDICVEQ